MRARRPEMCTPTILAAGHIKCAQAAIFVRTTGHFHARSRPFSVRVCRVLDSHGDSEEETKHNSGYASFDRVDSHSHNLKQLPGSENILFTSLPTCDSPCYGTL